ncbi:MAG: Ig-like domain-containing protein, partial [Thermoplasmata archaeon]|nr:Ig-like domain-containing protein [Thermoplasmata archaeon]
SCIYPPYLVSTDPFNTEFGVELDRSMVIQFSEPMNTSTVQWNVSFGGTPVPPSFFTSQWSGSDTYLTLDHAQPFPECKVALVEISGEDNNGDPLDPSEGVSNPFAFVTVCIPPYIVASYPSHQEIDVPLDEPVVIVFSEPMDTPTVVYVIDPNPGGLSESWSLNDTVLTIDHDPFDECTEYTVSITGARDMQGLLLLPPDSFSFTTICINPHILFTEPHDGQCNVDVTANILIEFNTAMDPTSLVWAISPDPGGWSEPWSMGNTVLTLTHANLFSPCTTYTIEILYLEGENGNPLVPLPFSITFTTVCANPYVCVTMPEEQEQDVSTSTQIIVTFSEAMDTPTVTWAMSPDPGPMDVAWSMDTVLFLTPLASLCECTDYTIEVFGSDPSGNPLVPGPVSNPWTFRTVCDSPVILRTDPKDGEENVWVWKNITIDFSEPMNISAGVVWNITPDPGGWAEEWSIDERNLTLKHLSPFSLNTTYRVSVIEAWDYDGNMLVPGPVPNPWQFSTGMYPPFYIVDTDPFDGEIDVSVSSCIWVNFSNPVNASSLSWMINPAYVLIPTWVSNTTLRLCPSVDLQTCAQHTITIVASDIYGQPLSPGPAPNPWDFTTECPNPYILWIYPPIPPCAPVDSPVVVSFSEPMDTPTVVWTIY